VTRAHPSPTRSGAVCLVLLFVLSALPGPPHGTASAEDAVIEWTAAGGPVVLASTFLVDVGETLRVGPGTEVRLASGVGIVVKGTLTVEGTEAAPVTFRPNASGDVVADSWEDVRLHADSAPNQHTVRWARFLGANAGLLVASCAARVVDCTFELCRYGIIARAGARLDVEGSTFSQIVAACIDWEKCQEGSAWRCTFEHNAAEGIYCNEGSSPTISECTFRDNYNHATFSKGSRAVVRQCVIEESSAAAFECYWDSMPVLRDLRFSAPGPPQVLVSNGSHPRIVGTPPLTAWEVIAVDRTSYCVAAVPAIVEVRNERGLRLEGVEVTVRGASGDLLSEGVTGADGRATEMLLANYTKASTGASDRETPNVVTVRLGNVTDTNDATVGDLEDGVLVIVLDLEPEGPGDARPVMFAVLIVSVVTLVVALAMMARRRRAQTSK
jgi:hypothetical protein